MINITHRSVDRRENDSDQRMRKCKSNRRIGHHAHVAVTLCVCECSPNDTGLPNKLLMSSVQISMEYEFAIFQGNTLRIKVYSIGIMNLPICSYGIKCNLSRTAHTHFIHSIGRRPFLLRVHVHERNGTRKTMQFNGNRIDAELFL